MKEKIATKPEPRRNTKTTITMILSSILERKFRTEVKISDKNACKFEELNSAKCIPPHTKEKTSEPLA